MVKKIAVVGLGYVGLPLAVSLAHHFKVTGFDINHTRIEELKTGFDHTHEIASAVLKSAPLHFTTEPRDLEAHALYIVTVPTPVTPQNTPSLDYLKSASEIIGDVLQKNAIVVFESTVYPGVTEDFCGKILSERSGLTCGEDFFLGYSPERINPGDREHTVDKITKIVSAQTPEAAEILRTVYGSINQNKIFVAPNIKTAEAAKVIENAQRDINIAFINEITMIMNKMGLSIYEVLDAANTKWNFLPFQPGLVGGHCIGVDPYYLAHCAQEANIEPHIILAGRQINESMSHFIAAQVYEKLQSLFPNQVEFEILILGLTFKENIPDLRNTKVIDLIDALRRQGAKISVHDSYADPREATVLLENTRYLNQLDPSTAYDCVLSAVGHQPYKAFTQEDLSRLLKPGGLLADVKRIWPNQRPLACRYWTL